MCVLSVEAECHVEGLCTIVVGMCADRQETARHGLCLHLAGFYQIPADPLPPEIGIDVQVMYVHPPVPGLEADQAAHCGISGQGAARFRDKDMNPGIRIEKVAREVAGFERRNVTVMSGQLAHHPNDPIRIRRTGTADRAGSGAKGKNVTSHA